MNNINNNLKTWKQATGFAFHVFSTLLPPKKGKNLSTIEH